MNEFRLYLTKHLRAWPPNMAVLRALESVHIKDNLNLRSPSLDLGCGDGKFASIVFGKLDKGIDISAKEIKRAKKIGSFSELHCCDAHNIPYPDDYFNTILSNCVLEHVPHPDGFINEIARVLKEKGEFIFTTWTPAFNKFLLINKKWYINWKNNILNHVSIKSAQEWQKILQKHKLQVVYTKYYLDCRKLKYLDFLELISLIGLWKFKIINVYRLLAPLFPPFLINKLAKSLDRFFNNSQSDDRGCAVIIKAIKKQ